LAAHYVVVVAGVVVTGFVSSIVVVGAAVVPAGGGLTFSYVPARPSTPLVGSGAGCPMPCAAGVSVFVCGALVMSGGAFW
jgi:hypothetical protein